MNILGYNYCTQIEERAKSDTPHFQLFMEHEEKGRKSTGEPHTLYVHTESNGLHFPAKKVEGNTSGEIDLYI